MEIVEGYPWCCRYCFEGTCGPWHLPHPCISTGMSHHWPNLHPGQTAAGVSHRSGWWMQPHSRILLHITQDLCVEISFLQSWNLSVHILGGQNSKYISLIFFIVRQPFRVCAVYCDTSSIVLKCNCSFEVFKISHISPGVPQQYFIKETSEQ